MFLLLTLTYFLTFSTVSIVDFEQVIARWVHSKYANQMARFYRRISSVLPKLNLYRINSANIYLLKVNY